MTTTSFRPTSKNRPAKDPGTAAFLSLVPGLGQLYNGDRRKGFLFLAVTAINLLILLVMIMTGPILQALWNFGTNLGLKPNIVLMQTIQEAHFWSPVSLIYLGLLFSFVAYAVRDAWDHATLIRRRHIYPEYIVEMPEAASGSYIFHYALMISCFVLAFFFLVPPPPKTQITDIEFIANQRPTTKKIHAPRRAQHASENAGKHEKKEVVAPSPAPKAPSKASRPTPKPTRQAQPVPSRAQPVPTPQPSRQPTPRPVAHPTAQPTPAPVAHPTPRPSPTPMPWAPFGAQAPMPSTHPSPVSRPTPTPTPGPVSIAHIGGSHFAPIPKAGGSSAISAFAPSAPSPIAVGGGGGNFSASPTPVPVVGGGGGGARHRGAAGGGGAPAPQRVTGGGRTGGSGPAIVVTPSVARPAGGGGGEGMRGNPDANSNPNGSPSVAAEADVDFGPYMADLQRRIKRAWFPPKGTESRRVVVVFKISRAGELSHLVLERSSGVAIADQAAMKAVENAAPFRPLPHGAPETVDIQFTFDYNVFTGGSGRFRQF